MIVSRKVAKIAAFFIRLSNHTFSADSASLREIHLMSQPQHK